jgi:hypothetical protein
MQTHHDVCHLQACSLEGLCLPCAAVLQRVSVRLNLRHNKGDFEPQVVLNTHGAL